MNAPVRSVKTPAASLPETSPNGAAAASAPGPRTGPATRQRRSRETRSELLERLENPTITLHEVSLLLRVCPATVRRYADAGVLPHERTAGGQRRFKWREVQVVMRDLQARRQKGRHR